MSNKRLIKTGFFALIAVGVIVFSLALLTGASSAQGPGGGGNGNGSRGQGSGPQGQQQTRQAGLGQNQNWLGNLPPAVPGDLPADVIDALYGGLMDEHHAYDTYQAVIDQFGAVRPFTNIQQAEASHIAALETLIERYGLDIPAIAPLPAVQPFATLPDACAAGVNAEIANFSLYDRWMATVQDYPDMVQVFTALRNASEFQHLPAFELCAG
jgi:hypothetical protein